MSKLVIVGGGYAGMWAALGAAHEVIENEGTVEIVVVSKDTFLTSRPRLYESNPETLRIPLAPTFGPLGIKLEEAIVISINESDGFIEIRHDDGRIAQRNFDKLVLASGSQLRDLPIPGVRQYGFNVDTYEAAIDLDSHFSSTLKRSNKVGENTVVILGAGLAGIEIATEMRARIELHTDEITAKRARIILIEQADVVGPDLGANPRPVIEAALKAADVELRLSERIEQVEPDFVTLCSGERIITETVIVTAGLRASPLAKMLDVELDELGRIPTDEMLRVKGMPNIYAAGDVARAYVDEENLALMSCQHSMTMGKFAGYNVARSMMDMPERPYRQPDYATCIDLGQSGALFTTGWDRDIQMTGSKAKQLKRQINTQWIHPPQGDREALLAVAHIDFGGTQ